jgi:hypothetical protein
LTLGGGLRGFGAQLFNPDGTKSGNQFLSTAGVGPTVAALTGGGYVIVWDDFNRDLRAQIFHADGTTSGSEFLVNATTAGLQQGAQITALPDGRFVVAWQDLSQSGDDPFGSAVRAQVFNPDGSRSGREFVVNLTTSGDQITPRIAALSDDNYIVIWNSNSPGGQPYSVEGRILVPPDPTMPVVGALERTARPGQQIALRAPAASPRLGL